MKKLAEKETCFAEVRYTVQVEEILFPREVLLDAGIDPEDEIETVCGDGAIIIRQRGILERLPDAVQERLHAAGLSEEALETALREEAGNVGGVGHLLERLQHRSS